MLAESISQNFSFKNELPGLELQIFILAGQMPRYLLWLKEKSKERKGLLFLLAHIFSISSLECNNGEF